MIGRIGRIGNYLRNDGLSPVTGMVALPRWERVPVINWLDLVVSMSVGAVPAVGLAFLFSISSIVPALTWVVLVAGWIGFTYSAYQKERHTERIGAGLFWLAVEAFAAPISILGFLSLSTRNVERLSLITVVLEMAGVFLVAWIVSWLLGVGLYLGSRRLEG